VGGENLTGRNCGGRASPTNHLPAQVSTKKKVLKKAMFIQKGEKKKNLRPKGTESAPPQEVRVITSKEGTRGSRGQRKKTLER